MEADGRLTSKLECVRRSLSLEKLLWVAMEVCLSKGTSYLLLMMQKYVSRNGQRRTNSKAYTSREQEHSKHIQRRVEKKLEQQTWHFFYYYTSTTMSLSGKLYSLFNQCRYLNYKCTSSRMEVYSALHGGNGGISCLMTTERDIAHSSHEQSVLGRNIHTQPIHTIKTHAKVSLLVALTRGIAARRQRGAANSKSRSAPEPRSPAPKEGPTPPQPRPRCKQDHPHI